MTLQLALGFSNDHIIITDNMSEFQKALKVHSYIKSCEEYKVISYFVPTILLTKDVCTSVCIYCMCLCSLQWSPELCIVPNPPLCHFPFTEPMSRSRARRAVCRGESRKGTGEWEGIWRGEEPSDLWAFTPPWHAGEQNRWESLAEAVMLSAHGAQRGNLA